MHDLAAERGVEAAAGVARDVGAQRAQQPLEHEQRDHAEHQDVQGLQRAVIDHLVVDGHQEDRRRERQEVDHHRGDAELPEHRAQAAHDRLAPLAGPGGLGQRLEQDHAAGEIGHGRRRGARWLAPAPGSWSTRWSATRRRTSQPSPGRRPTTRNGVGTSARLLRSGLISPALKPSRSAASSRLPSVMPCVVGRRRGADLGRRERPPELAAELLEGAREALASRRRRARLRGTARRRTRGRGRPGDAGEREPRRQRAQLSQPAPAVASLGRGPRRPLARRAAAPPAAAAGQAPRQ